MTGEFGRILLLAMLPALGNFAGGLLSEVVTVSERSLSLALHMATGILLAVVGVEIMPAAIQVEPSWSIIASFFGGGVFFILLDQMQERLEERGRLAQGGLAAWAVFFGVVVDLFADGVLIGTGSAISLELGLLLALAQVSADIPEGFAGMATLRNAGMPRARRLLMSASLVLPVLIGATVGYWLLRGRSDLLKYSILAFTAGVLTTLTVEKIIPLAHKGRESRLAALSLVSGFSLFTALALYLD